MASFLSGGVINLTSSSTTIDTVLLDRRPLAASLAATDEGVGQPPQDIFTEGRLRVSTGPGHKGDLPMTGGPPSAKISGFHFHASVVGRKVAVRIPCSGYPDPRAFPQNCCIHCSYRSWACFVAGQEFNELGDGVRWRSYHEELDYLGR